MPGILWIFEWIPSWFWSIVLIAGSGALVGSQLLRFVPVVNIYRIPLQIAGTFALIISIWFLGAASNEEKWKLKIKALEDKIAENEAAGEIINTVIEERIINNTKIVKEKGDEIIKYIDKEVVKNVEVIKFVENCPIPKEIIDIHNAAVLINKAAEGVKK